MEEITEPRKESGNRMRDKNWVPVLCEESFRLLETHLPKR